MKQSNYEKFSLIMFLIVLLFIFEVIFTINIINNKNELFINYSGVVMKKNICMFIIDNNEMNIIYKNKYLYFDGKKKRFSIEKITNDVIKKKDKRYNEVLLKFKFSNKKYKDNDVINISIRSDKEPIINMFKIIVKGENN